MADNNTKKSIRLSNIGYIDLSLNLMLGFAALFIILLMILKVEDESTPTNMETKGHLVIKITWPEGQDNDIDLWVKSEGMFNEVISFTRKQGRSMFLDRDDTGLHNDRITTSDGTVIVNPINQEILYIKLKGENTYTVNVHMYRVGLPYGVIPPQTVTGTPSDNVRVADDTNNNIINKYTKESTVTVELLSIDPDFRSLTKKEVTLTKKGQQDTAFVFETNIDGKVIDIDKNAKDLFVYSVLQSEEERSY